MFVELIDFNGMPARVDASTVIKLRPALGSSGDPLGSSGDPDGCVLVDYASGGLFAIGDLEGIAELIRPYIHLAALHAPDGTPIFVNARGIAALEVDDRYAGSCVAVVAKDFENRRVPARNKIALRETVDEAQAILEAAQH